MSKKFNDYEYYNRKAILCFGLEPEKAYAIHVILYNHVNLQTRFAKLYLWKNLLVKSKSKIESTVRRIQYHLYNLIVGHLVNNIVEDYEPLTFDLSNEDVLVVNDDGNVND